MFLLFGWDEEVCVAGVFLAGLFSHCFWCFSYFLLIIEPRRKGVF